MTSDAFEPDAARLLPEPPPVELPLVSVVVVNYNYGRFLAQAVGSVFAQSYRSFECIVVDNASTDETPSVLAELSRRHPALRVIRRSRNDGQTPASLDGLAAAGGEYVIFLDADDFLLPACLETHIYVHLSSRMHVGFTSGDMLQLAGQRVVVSTGEESGRVVRRGRRARPKLLRPFAAIERWPSPAVAEGMAGRIHYVPPLRTHWIWAPTSGLCFRRDALLLFADNERLATLRTGTDLYFAFGCSGLSGSLLIDAPVFAYRIHGGNIYTGRAQLDRTLNFTPGGHGDSNALAQLYLIDQLARRARRFAPNGILALNLAALLFKLDRSDIDSSLPRWARRSRAAQAIVRNYAEWADALGGAAARLTLVGFARSFRSPAHLLSDLGGSEPIRTASPS